MACVALATAGAWAGETKGTQYGDGVKLQTATPINELLSHPDQYVGKTVRVDGVIAAVCEEMGCWMELSDPATKAALRFKVDDGVIVFPVSAKGKTASAEGTFVKADAPSQHPAENAEHMARHAEKVAKDPAAHQETTQPYLVRATGAVIY
jgi:hypothetical protein